FTASNVEAAVPVGIWCFIDPSKFGADLVGGGRSARHDRYAIRNLTRPSSHRPRSIISLSDPVFLISCRQLNHRAIRVGDPHVSSLVIDFTEPSGLQLRLDTARVKVLNTYAAVIDVAWLSIRLNS